MSSFVPELNALFLITVVAVAVTGIVRGFTGFGMGLILAPGLSLVYPPSTAVVMVMLIDAPAILYLLPKTWRYADWPTMRWMLVSSALSAPLGAYFLSTTDPEITRRFIGIIALVFVLLMSGGFRIRNRGGMATGLTVGATAGYLGGATGIAGPPAILYFLAGPYSPEEARGNIIVFFGFVTSALVLSFFWQRLINLEVVIRCLFLVPIYMGALLVGNRLFGRASVKTFRRMAYVLVALLALSALVW